MVSVSSKQKIDVECLRALHEEGLSFAEIANILGTTRNVIAGRVSRMGLPRRKIILDPEERLKREEQKRLERNLRRRNVDRKKVLKKRLRKMRNPVNEAQLKKLSKNLTFHELEIHHCRFPYGETPFEFVFCGQPKEDKSSYCEGHTTLCLNKR